MVLLPLFLVICTFSATFGADFNPEEDVTFFLYTNKNPNEEEGQQIFLESGGSLTSSFFDRRLATRVLIHGWKDDQDSAFTQTLLLRYMERKGFNVFVVDWGKGSKDDSYKNVKNHVVPVGKVIARLLDYINLNGGQSLDSMYLIGHSFGGHVAGVAGKYVKRGKVNTIFALDVPMALYSENEPTERISTTDAKYVEVIHTNAGIRGFDVPIGHSDFYPNWGSVQPGCGVDFDGSCANKRSYQYFAESLSTEFSQFFSIRCQGYYEIVRGTCTATKNIVSMGGEPSNEAKNAEGVYYLKTKADSPFA